MSAPRSLWDCFQANRRSVLDIPLNEYSVAIWIYHNGPDSFAWAVPQTGTTCEFCGKDWTVLAAEFVAHRILSLPGFYTGAGLRKQLNRCTTLAMRHQNAP